MSSATIKGHWNGTKSKFKQKIVDWIDEDLMYVSGKRDELYGKIQKMKGNSKDKLYKMTSDSW